MQEIIEWVRFVVSTFYRAGASLGYRITLKLSSSYISQGNKEERHVSFSKQRKNWQAYEYKREFVSPRAICRDLYLGSWKECVRGKTNKTKWASQHCINC